MLQHEFCFSVVRANSTFNFTLTLRFMSQPNTVQESLKVQCEGMLEVVSTHEGFEEIDVEYEVEKVYQSNDNGREKGDIENEDDAGAEDKKYVDERA